MKTQQGGQNKHQTSTSSGSFFVSCWVIKNVPHHTQFPLQPTHRPTDPHYGVEGASQTCTLTFQLLWITSVCHAAEKKLWLTNTCNAFIKIYYKTCYKTVGIPLYGNNSNCCVCVAVFDKDNMGGCPGRHRAGGGVMASAKTFKPTKQAGPPLCGHPIM